MCAQNGRLRMHPGQVLFGKSADAGSHFTGLGMNDA
jgi:hypothetical protein